MAEMDADFAIRPRFSFVMPTYNTPDHLLRECLDSLLAQTYADFEICVADDNSPDRTVVATLEEYARKDQRVKYIARKANGHISAASNSALSLATGDFIVLVDHDDLIPDYTLFVLAYYINLNPDADILFS
jgi:glycosyltransferase involved in cell wall biosynthesis